MNSYRRTGLVAVAVGLALIGIFSVGSFGSAASATNPSTCHIVISAQDAHKAGNCPDGAHVATYKYKDGVPPGLANWDASLPQPLFDEGELKASLPDCAWQADLFVGATPQFIDVGHDFGPDTNTQFIDGAVGGSTACGEVTTTTTQPETTTSTTEQVTTTTEQETTTTQPETTTTTEPETTTSTTQPEDTTTTSTSVVPSTPPTSEPPTDIGTPTSVERPPLMDSTLPQTGQNNTHLLLIGLGIVMVGIVLLGAGKRASA